MKSGKAECTEGERKQRQTRRHGISRDLEVGPGFICRGGGWEKSDLQSGRVKKQRWIFVRC